MTLQTINQSAFASQKREQAGTPTYRIHAEAAAAPEGVRLGSLQGELWESKKVHEV
jgi:hypothetical protein